MSQILCPHCGASEPLRTRPQAIDGLLTAFLPITTVRCGKCHERFRIRSRRLFPPSRVIVWGLLIVVALLVIPPRRSEQRPELPPPAASGPGAVPEPTAVARPPSAEPATAGPAFADDSDQLARLEEALAREQRETARLLKRLAETEAGESQRSSKLISDQVSLQTELASMRGQLVTMGVELLQERELATGRAEEITELRAQMERFASAERQLDRERGRANAGATELAAARSRLAELDAELGRSREALADATTARGRSLESAGRLERQKELLERKLSSLLETYRQTNEEVDALRARVTLLGRESADRAAELEARAEQAGREASSREAERLARLGDLESELAAARGRIVTVWAELNEEKARVAAQADELAELRSQAERLASLELELGRERERGDAGEAELASSRGQLVTVWGELKEERARMAAQEEELAEAATARDGSAESADLLGRQNRVLEAKLASLLETHRQTRETIETLEARAEQTGRAASSRESELQARLADLEAELAAARDETSTVRSDLGRQTARGAAQAEELARLRPQAGRLASLELELNRERGRADTVEAQLAAARGRAAELEKGLEGSRHVVAAAVAARDGSTEALDLLGRRSSLLERQVASLLETYRQAHEELGALKARQAAAKTPTAPAPREPAIVTARPEPSGATPSTAIGAAGGPTPSAPARPEPVGAATPSPAAPSTTRPARPEPSGAGDVRALVAAWARAWSDQDAEAYLSHYGSDFTPGGGLDIEAWRQQRRQRVARPRSIQIVVDLLEVRLEGADRATAVFQQSYRSDTFADEVLKTLELRREDGAWRIARETSRPTG